MRRVIMTKHGGIIAALLVALATAVPASAQSRVPNGPAAPDLVVSVQADGQTALSWGRAAPFRQTGNEVVDSRVIAVPGSAVRLALWTEVASSGGETPYYAISLDGRSVAVARSTSYVLKLRHGDFDPAEFVPPAKANLDADATTDVYIVQFVTQPLSVFRDQITELGGTVYKFLAQHAYVVVMDPQVRDQVAALPYVRWVGPFHPAYRLEEFLRDNRAQADQLFPLRRYNIQVWESGLQQKQLVAGRIRDLGGYINMTNAGKYLLEATLTPEQLYEVITWDEVAFVDRWSPYGSDMDIIRNVGGANHVESVAGYTGEGVRGEILDLGFNMSHVDFAAHPLIEHTTVSSASHGASCSGIIFGDGTGNPKGRGLCPDGQGIVADWDVVSTGTPRYIHTGELVQDPYYAVLQSASVGSWWETEYTSISADHDAMLFDFDIIHCQSQSNAGSQSSRPQAWAKNVVSCGAVEHYDTETLTDDCWCGKASIGPASDGRVKPDLCFWYDYIYTVDGGSSTAYTDDFGGTSGATPTVAGHFGLFFQMWADGIFGNEVDPAGTVFDNRPHMATAKAVLVNTASAYEFSGLSHDLTRTHQGWGRPDVAYLYDMRESISVIDETEILQNLETREFSAFVDPGEAELRVTMVYADPPGTPYASQHRVNDLTLKVESPTGDVYWGNNGLLESNWSVPGGTPNEVDTVENVFLQDPEPGVWTVSVIASEIVEDGHVETPDVDDADFALVVSGALLATCTSQGKVSLGDQAFPCEAETLVRVIDCDLNTDDELIETLEITVVSDKEPAGEVVLLTETAAESADFRGSLVLSATDADGVLWVSDGDTVTATYLDEDDGLGGYDIEVTASATVDCSAPVISGVTATDIGSESATVTFDASEPVRSTVFYGLSCDALDDEVAQTAFETSPVHLLKDLQQDTRYYFAIEAEDAVGNVTYDDQGGGCYSFETAPGPAPIHFFPLDTDPGWAMTGEWQFGQPQGKGGYSHGNPDPTSGATGENVCGVNLAGDYSTSTGGPYFLTAGPFDCSEASEVSLHFQRWLNTDYQPYVSATIEVSNDGSKWTEVWDNGSSEIDDNSWSEQIYDLAAYADKQPTVYLRWGYAVSSGAYAYSGWNLDDIALWGVLPPLAVVPPDEYEIIRGELLAGGLDDLLESDDSHLVVKLGFVLSSAEPPVWLELTGVAPETTASEVRFVLEAGANSAGLTQKISLYNYDTGAFEEVKTGVATTSDSVMEVSITDDAGRFVDPATGQMKARLTWKANGPVTVFPWQIAIDRAIWKTKS